MDMINKTNYLVNSPSVRTNQIVAFDQSVLFNGKMPVCTIVQCIFSRFLVHYRTTLHDVAAILERRLGGFGLVQKPGCDSRDCRVQLIIVQHRMTSQDVV